MCIDWAVVKAHSRCFFDLPTWLNGCHIQTEEGQEDGALNSKSSAYVCVLRSIGHG